MRHPLFTGAAAIVLATMSSGCASYGVSGHYWNSRRHPMRSAGEDDLRVDGPERRLPEEPGSSPLDSGPYADKAARYRREAAVHDEARRRYEAEDPQLAAHCERLSRELNILADEFERTSDFLKDRQAAPAKPTKRQ